MRRLRRAPTVLAATTLGTAALALALSGCVNPAYQRLTAPDAQLSPAQSRPVRVSLPATPASYFGVFEPSIPKSYSQVARFGRAVGTAPNLVLEYTYWGEPFPIDFARQAAAHGATMVVDLDPTGPSVAAIADGSSDGYLEDFAYAVRKFGGPVIVSFGHEMNGNWYSWGFTHTSPKVFVRAWRHIVTVFRNIGADNVTWLWTINVIGIDVPPVRAWWPGASYVTWAGIDGYVAQAGGSYYGVFGPGVAAIRKITADPILIAETAVGQLAGQAATIPGLFAGLKQQHLLGLIWFDEAQSGGLYAQDWRLEGHAAAEAAFRRSVRRYLDLVPPAQQPGETGVPPQRT